MLTIFPALALDHLPPGSLRQTKHTREIDFDNCRPVFFRKIDCGRAANHAGVIDKNIDAAKTIERLGERSFGVSAC